MVRVPKRGGGFWERPFNPTSTDAQPGVVEFLVKVRPQQSSWGPTCLWQPQVVPVEWGRGPVDFFPERVRWFSQWCIRSRTPGWTQPVPEAALHGELDASARLLITSRTTVAPSLLSPGVAGHVSEVAALGQPCSSGQYLAPLPSVTGAGQPSGGRTSAALTLAAWHRVCWCACRQAS